MVIDASQNRLIQMSAVIELNRRKCGALLSDPGPQCWNSKILWGPDEYLRRQIAYYGSKGAEPFREMTVSRRWANGVQEHCFHQNYLSTDDKYLSLQDSPYFSVTLYRMNTFF